MDANLRHPVTCAPRPTADTRGVRLSALASAFALVGCPKNETNAGEECIEIQAPNDTEGLGEVCTPIECGDGELDPGEDCDYGELNALAPNTCRPDCTVPSCGDGVVDDASGEDCDGSWDCLPDCELRYPDSATSPSSGSPTDDTFSTSEATQGESSSSDSASDESSSGLGDESSDTETGGCQPCGAALAGEDADLCCAAQDLLDALAACACGPKSDCAASCGLSLCAASPPDAACSACLADSFACSAAACEADDSSEAQCPDCTVDTDENNDADSFPEALGIGAGLPEDFAVDRTICGSGDEDWVRFDPPHPMMPMSVTLIGVMGVAPPGDLDLEVYDASGALLGLSTGPTADEEVDLVSPFPPNHILYARVVGKGAAVGRYNVSFDFFP